MERTRPHHRASGRSLVAVRVLLALVPAGLLALLAAAPATAGRANAGIAGAPTTNPIAGVRWGVFRNPRVDGVYRAYKHRGGAQKRLLRRIANRPRVRWFGAWIPDGAIRRNVRRYLRNVTRGRRNVMAQLAVFRLQPWERGACRRLPTRREVGSYKRWINNFARGVGRSRVLLVLQPDLPFADCVPRRSTLPLRLVAYAARRLERLRHATVYLDGGAGDWARPRQVARWLRIAGVRHARGFALNVTHYHSTRREILYGRRIAQLLGRRGIHHKHFVISTSTNGRPFSAQQARRTFRRARTCRSRHQRRCVTLGIPPTTHVARRRWRLGPRARHIAARLADGYLWIGRPWLVVRRNTFSLGRALRVARTTPYR